MPSRCYRRISRRHLARTPQACAARCPVRSARPGRTSCSPSPPPNRPGPSRSDRPLWSPGGSVAHADDTRVVTLAAPNIAVLDPNVAVARLHEVIARAAGGEGPGVVLITDIDALLPAASPPPVATVVLEELRMALRRESVAV